MEIRDYNSSTSFTALRIKKNILKDLPGIYKKHEYQLRHDIEEPDKFVSVYGTVLPEVMLNKVIDNQKNNKLIDIVLGKFRFSHNPFAKKEPGIAIKKDFFTIQKNKLDTDIYRINSRLSNATAHYRSLNYEFRSGMYDQFQEAENIANSIAGFSKNTKMIGSLSIEGADDVLQIAIEKSPLIRQLRQKHNIDVFTIKGHNESLQDRSSDNDYFHDIYIDWREDLQGAYIIRGFGSTQKEADVSVAEKLKEIPLSDMHKYVLDKYNMDISIPTVIDKGSSPSLLSRIISSLKG